MHYLLKIHRYQSIIIEMKLNTLQFVKLKKMINNFNKILLIWEINVDVIKTTADIDDD